MDRDRGGGRDEVVQCPVDRDTLLQPEALGWMLTGIVFIKSPLNRILVIGKLK